MFNPAQFFQKLADLLSDDLSYRQLECENALLKARTEELEAAVEYLKSRI